MNAGEDFSFPGSFFSEGEHFTLFSCIVLETPLAPHTLGGIPPFYTFCGFVVPFRARSPHEAKM